MPGREAGEVGVAWGGLDDEGVAPVEAEVEGEAGDGLVLIDGFAVAIILLLVLVVEVRRAVIGAVVAVLG